MAESHLSRQPASDSSRSGMQAAGRCRSSSHALYGGLWFRIVLMIALGLLSAAAVAIAVAFNNGFAWLLMLGLVAGLIPVFSAAAARSEAPGALEISAGRQDL